MRIYFVRHGESQANVLREISDRGLRHGLTPEGRRQAVALAHRLQGRPIAHIYSSPVLRAIETSVLLAYHLGADYEVVDALRECDCGILEGRADEAAWRQYRSLYEAWLVHGRWEERIEGGESAEEVRRRFVPFVEGLVNRHEGEEALCVTHGGLLMLALPFVLANVDHRQILGRRFGYTGWLAAEPRPEGLVCVEWDGGGGDAPAARPGSLAIRPFGPEDEEAVVRLWERCGLTRPWNDPHEDIARKQREQAELFLVGLCDGRIVATAMAGYDGHRGAVYYLGVDPEHRGKGYGRLIMREVERRLTERGCPKLNLMVRSSNAEAVGFYRALGYVENDVVSLGRRLIED